MVAPTHKLKRPWPPLKRAALALAALAAALLALAWLGGTVALAQKTGLHLIYKGMVFDHEAGSGQLYKALAAEHGPLEGANSSTPRSLELEFFQMGASGTGASLGVELINTRNFYVFQGSGALPPEVLILDRRGFFYTLRVYTTWGFLQPYLGMGAGNYYVRYSQTNAGFSYLDSAPQVFLWRGGLKWMWGEWGVLWEAGQVSAPLKVRLRADEAILELGGSYTAWGLVMDW